MPPLILDNKHSVNKTLLSEKTLERFLSFCDIRKYPKKGVIFRETDPAVNLYYIIEGSVSVTSIDDSGNEMVLSYLHKGDFLGEIGIFISTEERSAMVRARTECQLAEISYKRYEELVGNELREQHVELLGVIGYQLSQRLVKTSKKIGLLSSMDVAGRIARTLMDMCEEPQAMTHPEGTQIHISRQEISRIVSCSRETVGRVLKQMSEDGMIDVKGMNIVVFHDR